MQRAGEQVARVAQEQSATNIFSRAVARRTGQAAPSSTRGVAMVAGSGQGFTIGKEYPVVYGAGTMVESVLTPIGGGAAFCIMVCRALKKAGI